MRPDFCSRWERLFERECPPLATRSEEDARLVFGVQRYCSSVSIAGCRKVLGLEPGEVCEK